MDLKLLRSYDLGETWIVMQPSRFQPTTSPPNSNSHDLHVLDNVPSIHNILNSEISFSSTAQLYNYIVLMISNIINYFSPSSANIFKPSKNANHDSNYDYNHDSFIMKEVKYSRSKKFGVSQIVENNTLITRNFASLPFTSFNAISFGAFSDYGLLSAGNSIYQTSDCGLSWNPNIGWKNYSGQVMTRMVFFVGIYLYSLLFN